MVSLLLNLRKRFSEIYSENKIHTKGILTNSFKDKIMF
jgi:hypothetical protein